MRATEDILPRICRRIAAHARPDFHTSVPGLLVSAVTHRDTAPDYSLTSPILVVMAQGGKRLLLGDRVYEYRAGDCLIVTADLPVTGHYLDVAPGRPALSMGLELRPQAIAELVLQAPRPRQRPDPDVTAISTGAADRELLDAVDRLLGLLERPGDIAVLAPLLEQEILWRVLTGPQGPALRQIGLADSDLNLVGGVIAWIRDNYAEPISVKQLAGRAGLSPSTLHRRFRQVTAMSPVQFQKRIRLQTARALLVGHSGDVASVGHTVGYDSTSQFTREYRRLFGSPPGRHAAQMRAEASF